LHRFVPLAQVVTGLPRRITQRASVEGISALALLRAGAFGIEPPQRLLRVLHTFQERGPAGAALAVATQRHGTRTAIIDERGCVSFQELDEQSGRLAAALLLHGQATITPEAGESIGILCRNHIGMFVALFAAAKLGARTVLLNTDFGAAQLADVCEREQVGLIVHDEEFEAAVAACRPARGTVLAWTDRPRADSIEALVESSRSAKVPRPKYSQRIVLLTSGTTGTPKGAAREFGLSLAIPGGYLAKIPLRSQENVLIAVPVFHAWGLLSSLIALGLADTLVLQRRTTTAELADQLQRFGCDTLITVPILLSRLLRELERAPRELAALRVVAVSGSALSPDLARRAREALGEVLYNLYGSTEVAYATIATPADLAAAPGSAGRPPPGTSVRILDGRGKNLPRGRSGRIFVGSTLQFGGYTGGGGKERVGGLMSTGDVGHLDRQGRLWIEGRDDDMIVSGGENVFPGEVENLLNAHPGIAEAAVAGVQDAEFGSRLRAFVVAETGASLDGAPLDEDAVKAYVKAHLARYKVPREVRFVDTLPRNQAGKVVRHRLPRD
jgi:fatty-acyl-CoA synthase